MEARNRVDTENGELSATLENLIEKGKEVCERLQDQTAAAATAGVASSPSATQQLT